VTKPLVVRTSSYWRLAVVLMVLFALQGAGWSLWSLPGLIIGTVVFFVLRVLLQRHAKSFQKRGLQLMAEERYAEAAVAFEAGFQFFEEHRSLDRHRAITMLDHSEMDWREIMLANTASNHAMAGNKARAIELYEHCLQLYPESRLAKPALRFLTAGTSEAG